MGFSATSTTTSTPIYVGGTSSRESIFRLPNFQTMQPSICTDHNLQSGDVPVFRGQTQTRFSCDPMTRNCTIAQSGMTYQTPETRDLTCIGSPPSCNMGIRKEDSVSLNVDTVPSVSMAARCSVRHIEVRGNLPSLYGTQSSLRTMGPQEFLETRINLVVHRTQRESNQAPMMEQATGLTTLYSLI